MLALNTIEIRYIQTISRYRIWHYSGVILEQVTLATGQELWEVFWQPAPDVYKEKNISYRPVQSDVQTPVPESKSSKPDQGCLIW